MVKLLRKRKCSDRWAELGGVCLSAREQGLFRLVYKSTSNIELAGNPFRNAILDILDWSQSYNPEHGITGALMVSNGHFAQVLEGERDIIRALYGNVACDPRHRFPTLLQFEAAEARFFESWSMAFVDEERQQKVPLSARPAGSDPSHSSVSADGILSLLQFLVRDD